MKYINFTIISIFVLLLIMSCHSTKNGFNPDTFEKEFLTFGTGGGFTGKVTKYFLLKDGTIYTKVGESYNILGNAPKQVAIQAFTNYETLGLKKINLNQPGNKYSFIERQKGQEKNSILWGKEPVTNKNIETFYTILMNIVKKLKTSDSM